MTRLAEQVLSSISAVVGLAPRALHEPLFFGNEERYLKECLATGSVASVGRFNEKFESELASYTGSRYAVCTVNGTAALHIALMVSGVQPGDEVLVPALTFIATANAVIYCGAIPHIVDCQASNLGIDVERLRKYLSEISIQKGGIRINRETGRRINTIVPMHAFGHPVDITGVLELSKEFNLTVIEDAAESLGSFYRDQHTGTFGTAGIISFNGNKTITTGGGGVILTSNPEIEKAARHLVTTAKVPHQFKYIHDQVGYNYRLPNLNAALGCAQLESLPVLLSAKRRLADRLRDALSTIEGVTLLREPPGCRSNYWLQTLILDDAVSDQHTDILKYANESGFGFRPPWELLDRIAYLDKAPRMPDMLISELVKKLINVPSSPTLDMVDAG
ncbi:LegC family aminotransferase [Gammaproteobacteria bacterium]|nr:LegC family aminotransferase [Gammaproteobacteria bacterium]